MSNKKSFRINGNDMPLFYTTFDSVIKKALGSDTIPVSAYAIFDKQDEKPDPDFILYKTQEGFWYDAEEPKDHTEYKLRMAIKSALNELESNM
jgi:hypothetical protein